MIIESAFLDAKREQADNEADALVGSYFSSGKKQAIYESLSLELNKLSTIAEGDLKRFLFATKPKPTWFDEQKIKEGQAFFYKQALPIMTLLGALSLPYCYAASPGNKALYFSEKMRGSTHKRLLDTAEFIIGVCSPNSLQSTGAGHLFINKIRLIHAIVRYYLKQKNQWSDAWGAPVNQEDMAGTNLAFSYLILKGMKQGGYQMYNSEIDAFLHLWKYIGYQLTIDENLLANNYKEAEELEKAIRLRHFKPSEEGRVLTAEIVAYYKTIVPNKSAANLMEAQIRYLLGPFVADCLGLPVQPVKDAFVLTVNTVRKHTLFLSHKTPSYHQMLSNQKTLKAKMFEKAK